VQLEPGARFLEGRPLKGDDSIGSLTGLKRPGTDAVGRERQGLGGKVAAPMPVSAAQFDLRGQQLDGRLGSIQD